MSLWQTKFWQEMLQKSHQTEKYFEVDEIFVEKRKVALGEYGLFALGVDFTKVDFEKLKKLCKNENALFVQVEDYYPEENPYPQPFPLVKGKGENHLFPQGGGNIADLSIIQGKWKKGFYKKFITPYTVIIDLTQTEDEILARMKQKGRYNIRLAEKKGIEVKEVEKIKNNVQIFYNLMQETTTRDGFYGNNFDYYFEFINRLENSKLLFASFEGKVISAGIFVYSEDIAIYYYGASTSDEKFRNLMAPYLLQWNAILIGKKLNCKIYDFLGVATPGDKNSKLAGVTDFKMKFTQDIRKVSESLIFVNKKWKYGIIQGLRKFKG